MTGKSHDDPWQLNLWIGERLPTMVPRTYGGQSVAIPQLVKNLNLTMWQLNLSKEERLAHLIRILWKRFSKGISKILVPASGSQSMHVVWGPAFKSADKKSNIMSFCF
jgi:hypothetical protein